MEQALICIIIGVVYGVPLLSAGISIYNCFCFKTYKSALLIGSLLSLLIYILLFFGIATISHNDEYSQYGILFSRFYQTIAQSFYMSCALFFGIFLIIKDKLPKNLRYFIYHVCYGIQIGLLFLIINPDNYLALLFNKLGITELFLEIFSKFYLVSLEQIDIKKDLIDIQYSLKSKISIMIYLIFNSFSIALPIIVRFFNHRLKMANNE